MDPCSMRRASVPQERRAGAFPSTGIWAALSNSVAAHPSSLMHANVRGLHSFLPGNDDLDHSRSGGSVGDGGLALAFPSAGAASSPIQAAPGPQYRHYRTHAEQEDADRGLYPSMRHSQSAPIDVQLQPLQWRSGREQGKAKARRKCGRDEEDEQELEEDDEEDAETVREYGEDADQEAEDEEEEEEEEEAAREERLPPHELVAREWAAATSGGGSAFSLCQGVGRTLKGRDLCRVRNAILKQTGFI